MTLMLILCLNYYYLKMFIFRFVFFSNTLETMSARSFGFIKPSQKFRDNDMANRIRRHQSFFNADTSSITGKRETKRLSLGPSSSTYFSWKIPETDEQFSSTGL